MTIAETAPAHDILLTTAEQANSGTEIAEKMQRSAADIRGIQQDITSQIYVTAEGGTEDMTMSVDTLQHLSDAGIVDQQALESLQSVESVDAGQDLNLTAVADTMEQTGEDIRKIVVNKKAEVLKGNIAGQAYQGEEGSSVIDVTAAVRPSDTSVIDTEMLDDTVKHELEHEKQAAEWNTQSIDVGAHQSLTRKDISETAAMSVQSTLENVSDEYKEIYARVTSVIDVDQAVETARSGDLEALGDEIREDRGVEAEETEDAPAGEAEEEALVDEGELVEV